MKIISMAGSHSKLQIFSLPLHNLAVVTSVHHNIVQQVGFSILGAGGPEKLTFFTTLI
jgi:hypothetical protein